MSAVTGPKSDDRSTRGEYLTREEQDALAAGYPEGGDAEMPVLREAAAGAGAYATRPAGLSVADRRVAATLKRHLAEIGRPVEVRVFGSRARGEATWESDLDISIELEAATAATRRRIEDLGDRLRRRVGDLAVRALRMLNGLSRPLGPT